LSLGNQEIETCEEFDCPLVHDNPGVCPFVKDIAIIKFTCQSRATWFKDQEEKIHDIDKGVAANTESIDWLKRMTTIQNAIGVGQLIGFFALVFTIAKLVGII
jgi:hypothetical protein